MMNRRPSRLSRLALVSGVLAVASIAVGATVPDYPDLGKADQSFASQTCATTTIDDVQVCTPEIHGSAGVTVTTVAPGLSVVD